MRQQPPAPVIGGQDRKGLIHEHAAPLGRRELTAIIVQIVERFDVIDQLPVLARPHDGRGEGQGVERHVVLAHELNIAHVVRALVRAPPAFPIRVGFAVGIGPFGGRANIFDGGVEPDIEHLALHARPVLIAAFYRHAPFQVAGDATVLQAVAVMQPFLGDRGRQHGPAILCVDPLVDLAFQGGLAQVKVLGLAHLKVGRSGNRRARLDQIGRVQLLGAVFALIPAGLVIATVGAGALDITVGQETAIGVRIDLLFRHFLNVPVLGQLAREMLGQGVVAPRGRAAIVVKRQTEPPRQFGLFVMHPRTVIRHLFAGFRGGQFGGRAVFVRRTDEHDLMAALTHVTGVQIRRQL